MDNLNGVGRNAVYPRAGGATTDYNAQGYRLTGLSPRWRGNRLIPFLLCRRQRSIPALAGQPDRYSTKGPVVEVYPRAGGATPFRRHYVVSIEGLSPRWRGNRPAAPPPAPDKRSIPALAGQPHSVHSFSD